jgi:lysozyme family protein
MTRFQKCLQVILKHEGGFVNHPKDPGGITNLGVTKRVWEAWVKRPVTEDEMRRLTPAVVAPLYEWNYWRASGADRLPPGIDLSVFDFAVNAGPRRAIRTLQECVGSTPDGLFGPATLKASVQADAPSVIREYAVRRLSFYRTLPTFSTFGRGWSRRVGEVEATSLEQVNDRRNQHTPTPREDRREARQSHNENGFTYGEGRGAG